MISDIERRSLATDVHEHEGRVVFYPIIFNQRSEPIGEEFVEEIAPSAVTKTLAERSNIVCDFAHDGSQIFG